MNSPEDRGSQKRETKGHKDEDLERLAAQEPKIFPYKTLVAATNHFHPENELAVEGFESLYKGKLKDGREIAVKKLSKKSEKGMKEFIRDANSLSSLKHPNVVRLLGYAAHNDEPFLVYEYVSNTSLEKLFLFSTNWREQIDWTQRYKIIEGTANGLNYLHGGSQNRIIIHRNINPGNILLDHKWKPVISGLGATYTHVAGTGGYMAPEYWNHVYMSVKIDVYSFGVLMLELISGKRHWTFVPPEKDNAIDLFDWAHKLYEENRSLEFMDPTLADFAKAEQVTKCFIIGLLCIQGNPKLRPDMDHVVSLLKGKESIMGIRIGRPGHLGYDESEPTDSDVSLQQTQLLQDGHEDENLKKKIAAQNCQKFGYETLRDATSQFNCQNVLGQGGFGVVYKGKLDDGREIAVKKSSVISEQLRKTLLREAELLSSVKHPNVIKLLGYCTHDNGCLLVYEYVPNKSLDKLLFGPNGREQELDWRRTYGIIVGIAKGLSYLHADPQNCIIHRDIKAGNILLHHKWVPKIADFGISRLFDGRRTHDSTGVVGTWGYIAPEYLELGHLSVKADVYSFGVLVLELVSGKRYSFELLPQDNAVSLLDWIYKLFKAGRTSEIMDPALADSAVMEQVVNCIKIGLLCTQGNPKSRPDMERVVCMLTLNQVHWEKSIGKPGIFGYRGLSLK